MADELEVKAVVPDADALRRRLRDEGAIRGFTGVLEDRRFDRGGELSRRDEVLRVRTYRHAGGGAESRMSWKGPTRRTPEGYKLREELECAATGDDPALILHALGYIVVQAIDRYAEYFTLHEAVIRLETYPRMHQLVEIEGAAEVIERAIAATGIPRADFTAETLGAFVLRFEARERRAAALSMAALDGPPPWIAA